MPFQPQSSRKESSPNAQANLPPSDVARTIPCRNYPNCKYGAGCVFYHPRSSGPVSGFYSGPPSFAPNGPYNPAYVPLQPNGMSMPGQYYIPNNFPIQPQQHVNQDQSPPEQHQQQTPQEYQHQHQHQPQTQQQIQSDIPEASTTQHDHTQSQSVPSAIAPPFVPAFNTPQPSDLSSPPPPSQFGGSLMSPSMLATSPIAIPSAEAFLAASPTSSIFMSPTNGPNGFMPGMNGNSHFRRQSLNQQSFGMQVKPFGHGKKLSFSGVPRPYGQGRTSSGAGSWKDGNPPPCAFFGQGKCRNGELCKFPHLDADGNDCEWTVGSA